MTSRRDGNYAMVPTEASEDVRAGSSHVRASSGSSVVPSHARALASSPRRVRFFLGRSPRSFPLTVARARHPPPAPHVSFVRGARAATMRARRRALLLRSRNSSSSSSSSSPSLMTLPGAGLADPGRVVARAAADAEPGHGGDGWSHPRRDESDPRPFDDTSSRDEGTSAVVRRPPSWSDV